jgi:hypothetical protein
MAPANVTKKDEVRLWKLQYRGKYKLEYKSKNKLAAKTSTRYVFKNGDTVRISHMRGMFEREYDERWTMEYFVVDGRGKKQKIPYYTLKDITGDAIQGTFHRTEFNKVAVTEDTVYRIEKYYVNVDVRHL